MQPIQIQIQTQILVGANLEGQSSCLFDAAASSQTSFAQIPINTSPSGKPPGNGESVEPLDSGDDVYVYVGFDDDGDDCEDDEDDTSTWVFG